MAAKFDATNTIESQVNLDSYSSSNGFSGFCHSIVGWDDERCTEAFLDILDFFLATNQILVSSIRIHGDLETHAELYELSAEDIRVRDNLVSNGIILVVNSDDENGSFHFAGNVSNGLLKDFVLYQSSIGGLSYHGFLTSQDSGLVVYPHDDCGLGFICYEKNKIKKVIKKLQEYAEHYSDILGFMIKA